MFKKTQFLLFLLTEILAGHKHFIREIENIINNKEWYLNVYAHTYIKICIYITYVWRLGSIL